MKQIETMPDGRDHFGDTIIFFRHSGIGIGKATPTQKLIIHDTTTICRTDTVYVDRPTTLIVHQDNSSMFMFGAFAIIAIVFIAVYGLKQTKNS